MLSGSRLCKDVKLTSAAMQRASSGMKSRSRGIVGVAGLRAASAHATLTGSYQATSPRTECLRLSGAPVERDFAAEHVPAAGSGTRGAGPQHPGSHGVFFMWAN